MTIAEKIVEGFETGKISMGNAVKFAIDSGLLIEESIDNTGKTHDEYVFRDSSIMFVNWTDKTITC